MQIADSHVSCQCDLCCETARVGINTMNLFARILPDKTMMDKVVLRSFGVFKLIPAVGALIDGHCLLVPEFHFSSYSELMSFAPDATQRAIAMACDLLRQMYSEDVVIFEHGPLVVDPSCARSKDDHAHLHIMPLGTDLTADIRSYREDISWQMLGDRRLLAQLFCRNSYLFFQHIRMTGDEEVLLATFALDYEVPKQFFRRVIARYLGRPGEWRWEDHDGLANIESTVRRLWSMPG